MKFFNLVTLFLICAGLLACKEEVETGPLVRPFFYVSEDGQVMGIESPDALSFVYHSSIGTTKNGARFDDNGVAEVVDLLSNPPVKLQLSKDTMHARSNAGFQAERSASLVLNTITVVGINLHRRAELPALPTEFKKKGPKIEYFGPGSNSGRPGGLTRVAPTGRKRWKRVTMYSGSWCPNCQAARRWLDQNGVRYDVIQVPSQGQPDARYLSAARRAGAQVVPIFEIGANRSIMKGWSQSEFERRATY